MRQAGPEVLCCTARGPSADKSCVDCLRWLIALKRKDLVWLSTCSLTLH